MTPNDPVTPPGMTPEQKALAVKALKVAGAVAPFAFAYAAAALSGHPMPLDLGAVLQAVASVLGSP